LDAVSRWWKFCGRPAVVLGRSADSYGVSREMASQRKLVYWIALLGALHGVVVCAGFFAPYDPEEQVRTRPYVPPMRIHFVDARGRSDLSACVTLGGWARAVFRVEYRRNGGLFRRFDG